MMAPIGPSTPSTPSMTSTNTNYSEELLRARKEVTEFKAFVASVTAAATENPLAAAAFATQMAAFNKALAEKEERVTELEKAISHAANVALLKSSLLGIIENENRLIMLVLILVPEFNAMSGTPAIMKHIILQLEGPLMSPHPNNIAKVESAISYLHLRV